ncbi:ribokinase [Pelagicoccus mobilis]|uniref:Ribokinase n=1 Tax=Pelagicoccus mobilis TaxID=415221 RepID=A0A934RXT1_9BACT|nr:ribokinase [Pelagicoccus mobilis]MBK1878732.1 ribokinase [Pelagicoccus mobilis]
MKKTCVIGSLNVDLFVTADHFPRPGENVNADDMKIFTGGGKGANQAFSLGRLGAPVSMVGKLGKEFYGPKYLQVLKDTNVDCELIGMEEGFPGVGIVAVDRTGENSIYVYPGANGLVAPSFLEENWSKIEDHDLFLFQLEIPIESNLYAMKRLKESGKTIILDPAPAQEIPDEMLQCCDIATPNRTELENLTNTRIEKNEDVETSARILLSRGVKTVVTKAGPVGAFITTAGGTEHLPGFKVDTVDTTAAGDSFNAGLAYALGRGDALKDAVVFGNATAAISTTALGAQNAMPTLEQVNALIQESTPIVSTL